MYKLIGGRLVNCSNVLNEQKFGETVKAYLNINDSSMEKYWSKNIFKPLI